MGSVHRSARRGGAVLACLCFGVVLAGCEQADGAGGGSGGVDGAVGAGGGAASPTDYEPPAAGTGGMRTLGNTGTGGGGGGTMAAGDGTWCAARAVFETACHTCHGEQLVGGAPMSIVTHMDTAAPAISDPSVTVGQLIDARIHDEARPMPPLSQPRLTDAQMGALEAWIAAGMPGAGESCETTQDPPDTGMPMEIEWPEDCQERYEIRAHQNGNPYPVPAGAELNINIEIPVPWDSSGGPVQALAIRPLTSNARVVHHWILYSGSREFITSWSPGKPFEVFPEGVGVHMPSSGNFRLNMHYYNVGNDSDELDDSGLEVCITRDLRPSTATTYMFAGSATVPPGARVENVSTCTVNATEPIHLITSSPHMHSYGVGAKLEVIRPDGQVEVIEDAPFSWEDQHVTPVDTTLNDGDQVRITCIYENNTARTIRFGESSEDEMCFNFARYYPKDAFTCRRSFFP